MRDSGRTENSPCRYRLCSYLEEPITVLGCMDVQVMYKEKTAQVPLIVY